MKVIRAVLEQRNMPVMPKYRYKYAQRALYTFGGALRKDRIVHGGK
jgi:hypothetical protein